MDLGLDVALAALGLGDEVSALRAANRRSERWIQAARDEMAGHAVAQELTLVAFGSLARREMLPASDLDYLVVATGIPDDLEDVQQLLRAADKLRFALPKVDGLDRELREPGATGMFGKAIGSFDVLNTIGLQSDTNHSLTRRMLIIEESVSLWNEAALQRLLNAALGKYLAIPSKGEDFVPRYLLNDVVRYWRTVAVDYQAKASELSGANSGLRLLKLRIPRKIAYAGTLVSLLGCELPDAHKARVEDLNEQFTAPPLARLLQLRGRSEGAYDEPLRAVAKIANQWIEWRSDVTWRQSIMDVERPGNQDEAFCNARVAARELQRELERIFFDVPEMATLTRRYLAL
jgi:predicted nucleotidyltransferase